VGVFILLEGYVMDASQVLKVNMLGEFSLSYGGKSVNDQNNRAKKLWSLLEYLIAFRDKEVAQEEIIELLWPEDDIEDPANTLKTLLHRARSLVGEIGFPNTKELIKYRRGTYSWSTCFPIQVDTEEFEKLLENAKSAEDEETKLNHLLAALNIYKGDFLPRSSGELWATTICEYYHSRYIRAVHEVVDILSDAGRHPEIISICNRATSIDPYDEHIHCQMIKALIAQGSQQAALRHYEFVTELFFSRLGVNPSDELVSLYKDIVKTTKNKELDLNVIKDSLNEKEKNNIAFYCEYEFFKDIYRLEARSASRSGRVVQVALITLQDPRGNDLPKRTQTTAMERLMEVISSSLRKGDVFTRYSISQYLIMLPLANFEDGNAVLKRTVKAFKLKYPKMNVELHFKLIPLDPVM
jgi:DNA-binding SARP family transcriptional activator